VYFFYIITQFRSTPSVWSLVLDQCLWLLTTTHHPAISEEQALSFLQPVLLYLFCDPNYHAHFSAFFFLILLVAGPPPLPGAWCWTNAFGS
jgi:hypothetical protein